MDIKTGMLLKSKITSEITGMMQAMGRDVPLKIMAAIKIEGKYL